MKAPQASLACRVPARLHACQGGRRWLGRQRRRRKPHSMSRRFSTLCWPWQGHASGSPPFALLPRRSGHRHHFPAALLRGSGKAVEGQRQPGFWQAVAATGAVLQLVEPMPLQVPDKGVLCLRPPAAATPGDHSSTACCASSPCSSLTCAARPCLLQHPPQYWHTLPMCDTPVCGAAGRRQSEACLRPAWPCCTCLALG